jgi:hypothetical protein
MSYYVISKRDRDNLITMCKRIGSTSIFFLLLLDIAVETGDAQEIKMQSVRLMFYNVENFFDTSNDTLTNDDDFLPGGLMRWNPSRYKKKINSLYKTIISAGEWEPPEIVAMCEVENRDVLEDLIYNTYLSKFKYSIIHEESPDQRGIDVCLIYRSDLIKVLNYRYWIPQGPDIHFFTSRSILYAGILCGLDTIHLFINHWPSRRGGVLSGESLRLMISSMVRAKADSIAGKSGGRSKIIIAGDFNSTPDDQEIRNLVDGGSPENTIVNLSESLTENSGGTYRYMGSWEMIDQVMVSKYLLNCASGYFTDYQQLSVVSPQFLLMKDPKYPGFTPFSTYRGYRYQGGFSDHLPVMIRLNLRSTGQQE